MYSVVIFIIIIIIIIDYILFNFTYNIIRFVALEKGFTQFH